MVQETNRKHISSQVTGAEQHDTKLPLRKALWKRVLLWTGAAILALILIVLIVGLIPVSLDGLEAQPDSVADYDEAVARVEQIMQEEAPITNESSRSIFLTHGEKVDDIYVLVHGVNSGTPAYPPFHSSPNSER